LPFENEEVEKDEDTKKIKLKWSKRDLEIKISSIIFYYPSLSYGKKM
jgi:hypothetical protein